MQQTQSQSQDERRGGLLKCIVILFLVSLVASFFVIFGVGIHAGVDPVINGRFLGEVTGAASVPFFIALIVLLVVRFFRTTSASTAGLASSIVIALVLSALSYGGLVLP